MKGVLGCGLLAMLPAAAAAQEAPAGELGNSVRPLAYRVDLIVDPSKEKFSGETIIEVELTEPTATVYLHGQKLDVRRVEAVSSEGTSNLGVYAQPLTTGVAQIKFDKALPAGRHELKFAYDAPFQTGAEGLYRVKVGDNWYAWTQMEPLDARRVFPSFDEPRHKVPVIITITAPTGQKAYSNTPLVRSTPVSDGLVRHEFAPSKPLPTYLIAIAVGDFDEARIDLAANSTRTQILQLRHIATKGQARRLGYGVRETPKILAMLEDYFGIPYPYEKLDQIATPIMGGAMENAGLITYDDTLLLLDADAPLSQQRDFGVVVTHELAHQWFGNLVTPRWWDDIWLNESFAEWMGNKVAALWRPDIGAGPAQLRGALEAMDADSRAVGRPILQPIKRNEDVKSAFDAITYQKGGQVLEMVEAYLGGVKFRDGVRAHVRRFPHSTATSNDFFQSIALAAGDERIIRAFETFVTQQGVPLIEVRSLGNGSYALRQQRYRPIGVPAGADQSWIVPVCTRTAKGSACTLLEDKEGRLTATGGGWLLPNAKAAGYYRFDLEPAGWTELTAAVPSLTGEEAMAVADSAWASFKAGRAPLSTPLALMRVLANNNERLAATFIPRQLAELSGTLMTEADRAAYRRLLAGTFAPRLRSLGLDVSRGAYVKENAERRELRQQLAYYVGVEGRDPAVRQQLVKAAQDSLQNSDALDPGYRPAAFVAAVQDLGEPFMQRLLNALGSSDDPLFRRHAAQGIGAADSVALGERALAMTSHEKLNSLEKVIILFSLLGEPETREIAFNHITRNFDTVESWFGGFGNLILDAGSGYCSEADARRVDAALRPRLKQIGGGELDLNRSLAGIRQCAALKAAKAQEISSAMRAY